MLMPEKTAQSSPEPENKIVELPSGANPPAPPTLPETKAPRSSVLHKLGKLKPLLPVISGGLRLVDHGAVQAIAQLLHFIDGSTSAQAAAHDDLQQGFSEIQTSHRELSLQVQDQTVEIKRIEEQIVRLRQSTERTAAEHAELAENVKSLRSLVRAVGAVLAVLLIVLIALTGFLLLRRG